MTNAPVTLSEKQTAAALGLTVDFFRRERPELEANGFPPPVYPDPDRPGARNRRWSPAAVQAWIDRPRAGADRIVPPWPAAPDADSDQLAAAMRDKRRQMLAQSIPSAAAALGGSR